MGFISQFVRACVSELVDEVVANLLLHGFFRYGRQPIAVGPSPPECLGLYSGDLEQFYSPRPAGLDLREFSTLVGRNSFQTVWDYQFESETVTRWPENNVVRGIQWKAANERRGLTVVAVHGIVQVGHSWFERLAERLNPRGIDLVMVESPFNYRRTPEGYRAGQLIVNGDLGHQLAVVRQGVLDVWRVVESLQQQGDQVGLLGISYGGWLSLLTAVLAENLKFVEAVVPPVDVTQALRRGGTLTRAFRPGLSASGHNLEQFAPLARPVIPGEWQPRLPGSAITLHAARYDRFVSCSDIEDLSHRWGTRLVVHNDAHCRPAISTALIPQLAEEIIARST